FERAQCLRPQQTVCVGDQPYDGGLAHSVAPASLSAWVIEASPRLRLKARAVPPLAAFILASAPLLNSRRTVSPWPVCTAAISGVEPFLDCAFTSTPRANR